MKQWSIINVVMFVMGVIELALCIQTYLHCDDPALHLFDFICKMEDTRYFWLPCAGQIFINVSRS